MIPKLLTIAVTLLCLFSFGADSTTSTSSLGLCIGYVSQAVELDPEMTGAETLGLFAGRRRAWRHLVPLKQMPDWLATVSRVNPLSLAVESSRQALLFGEFGSLPRNTVLLAFIAVLLFSMACFAAGSPRRRF